MQKITQHPLRVATARKQRWPAMLLWALLLPISCSRPTTVPTSAPAPIYPDYCGVTIPAAIAPLNFTVTPEGTDRVEVRFAQGATQWHTRSRGAHTAIPAKKWSAMLQEALGDSLHVYVSARIQGTWTAFEPFVLYVSPNDIDYGLAYRLIQPGYEVYSKMGIYQRNLSTFEQKAVYENTHIVGSCVNCHSFRQGDPSYMSLHLRGTYGATILQRPDDLLVTDTKTDSTISSWVYPYWHPSSQYVAYSVNTTRQAFHIAHDQRIEVFDTESDVVVYRFEDNTIRSTPLLKTADFETFPAFSPDGRRLYFCTSQAFNVPQEYKEIRYNLCSIAFNPETGTFGTQVDTLINARALGKSITLPRPSYDGRFLLFTLSDYGTFPIWHKEADLGLLDLTTGTWRLVDEVNSPDTDSYHSWSSNGHWVVFSSRRGDGLYTRPYIASVDAQGRFGKPFLLPQRQPLRFYDQLLFSYNIPEFITAPVTLDTREVVKRATKGPKGRMQTNTSHIQ